MSRISNIDNIPKKYIEDPDFKSDMKTLLLGDALGSEKNDVAIYPDEDIIFLRDEKLLFNINDTKKNWSSDPNE